MPHLLLPLATALTAVGLIAASPSARAETAAGTCAYEGGTRPEYVREDGTAAKAQARPQAEPREAVQSTQDGDTIADLRRALAQPGPEGRPGRRGAVEKLLSMSEREAHAVLSTALGAETAEPGDLRAYGLEALARRWGNPLDPVFGERGEGRAELHRLYATMLLGAFTLDPPIAIEPRREADQERVWQCFRVLSAADRKRVFETFAKEATPELWRTAMWAMSGSRDLGLAPLIAAGLDGEEVLSQTAGKALTRLTFVKQPFESRAAFDAWYEVHSQRRYVDLAERAAHELNSGAQQLAQEVEVELVGALAIAENVDWNRISRALLRGTRGEGDGRPYLLRLRDALASRTSLGGATAARIALVKEMQGTIDAGLDSPDLDLRIELLARLVTASDAEFGPVMERLAARLEHEDPVIRAAAIRGLAVHFSPAHRDLIVRAGQKALIAGQSEILTVALESLASPAWVAPSETDSEAVGAWLALLDGILQPNDLALRLKERAIHVAVQPTAEGNRLAGAFELLQRSAGPDRGLAVAVRKQALSRLRVFTDDEARAGTYVRFVTGLLADGEAEMREDAAVKLRELPDGSRKARDEWTELVVSAVGERLLVETEEEPLRKALACLMQIGGGATSSTNVIGKFTAAVDAFLAREVAQRRSFRRDVLVEGLRRLGSMAGRPLVHWVRAAEGLARLEDRAALRGVLERQGVASLVGQNEEGCVDAWRLVIAGALLLPDGTAWADQVWPGKSAEVQLVQLAFSELDRLKVTLDEPRERALRVETCAALDKHDDVIRLGTAALADAARPLTNGSRLAVGVAVARSHVAKSQIDLAHKVLESVAEVVPAPVPGSLSAVRAALARQHFQRSEFGRAEDLVAAALAATAREDVAYPEYFLLSAEIRYAKEPTQAREAVLAELRSAKDLFERESTPAPVRSRYNELLETVGKG